MQVGPCKFQDISKRVTVHILRHFDLPACRSELSKINFDHIKTLASDPNEMWLLWKTFFLDVPNKYATILKIKGNNLPYITAKVRKFARQ